MAAAMARCDRVRAEACRGRWQARDRLTEKPRLLEPPDEVAVTDPARTPWGLPAREDDIPAGLPEFLGKLAARLPAADDQDRARGQAGRVAVLLHVHLQEPCRQRRGAGGAVSALEGAGGEDDAVSVDVAGGRQGDEAVPCSLDGPDGDALPDGRSQGGRVPLEVGDDLSRAGSRRDRRPRTPRQGAERSSSA